MPAMRAVAPFAFHTHMPIIGQWIWNLSDGLVYGDANLAEFFCLAYDEVKRGLPIERYLAAVHEDDRFSLRQEISGSVGRGTTFLAIYRVKTLRSGERTIVAFGKPSSEARGVLRSMAGWFVDVTGQDIDRVQSFRSARLEIAAIHIERAQEILTGSNDLVTYLLDNVAEEVRVALAPEFDGGR